MYYEDRVGIPMGECLGHGEVCVWVWQFESLVHQLLMGDHQCNHCCFLYHFCSYDFYLFRNLVTGSVSLILPYLKDRPKTQFGNEKGELAGDVGSIC